MLTLLVLPRASGHVIFTFILLVVPDEVTVQVRVNMLPELPELPFSSIGLGVGEELVKLPKAVFAIVSNWSCDNAEAVVKLSLKELVLITDPVIDARPKRPTERMDMEIKTSSIVNPAKEDNFCNRPR